MASSFREGWITVSGVSSHVLTWGGWVEDPLPPGDTILVFMCGIPGLTFFYRNFLESIYNHLKIPVWTICIAGHEMPPPDSHLTLPNDKSLYDNVNAQVNHKIEFVNKYVPKDRKLIIIGHSFGGKMATELLKDDDLQRRTQQCYLLMPTIERFSDLPGTHYWLKITRTGFIYFILLCVLILSLFPISLRKKCSRCYFKYRGFTHVDQYCEEGMAHFLHPTVFNNVRALVWDEQTAIADLDTEVLARVKDKTKVFFAADDPWAPLTHYHSLKAAVPQLPVEILDSKFEHAFTINTSQDMVDILIHDMKENQLVNMYIFQ